MTTVTVTEQPSSVSIAQSDARVTVTAPNTLTVSVAATTPAVSVANTTVSLTAVAAQGPAGASAEGPYVAKTGDFTLTTSEYTVNVTANSATLTLPTAVGKEGKLYNLKNSGNGVVTIATTGGQTIDGNASGVLKLVQRDCLTVQSTGANWIIL